MQIGCDGIKPVTTAPRFLQHSQYSLSVIATNVDKKSSLFPTNPPTRRRLHEEEEEATTSRSHTLDRLQLLFCAALLQTVCGWGSAAQLTMQNTRTYWCCRVEINVETSCPPLDSSSFDALLMMNEFLIRLRAQLHTALGFPSVSLLLVLPGVELGSSGADTRYIYARYNFPNVGQLKVYQSRGQRMGWEWLQISLSDIFFTTHTTEAHTLEITRFSMFPSL